MNKPVQILKQYWGHDTFRPLQEDIINSVLSGRDTVALLPTGGGKSVCFQVPAVILDGICIVISPLIALMNDQVTNLNNLGIKSLSLSGNIAYSDLDRLLDNCIYGNYKFLYLSPERLQQDLVQQRIKLMNVNMVAIDEAHCISQWGNDFRPAYKNLHILREIKPDAPFIALTATATEEVLADTIHELNLKEAQIFKKSFYRENLAYLVWKEEDKLHRIRKLLADAQPAIVYTRNRKSTEEISRYLNSKDIDSSYYHGGITAKEKKDRFKDWMNEKTPVIVATNAFGMGIDKPNVRTVIHYDLPESLESYFQEAGRAGRDGVYSRAIVLFNEADVPQLKNQFLTNLPTVDYLKLIYRKLCNYFYIAYGEGEFTTHNFNFGIFCNKYELNTLKAFNAIQALDRLGVINLSLEFGRKTDIRFLMESKYVIAYFEKNLQASIMGKTILRIYTGIFEKPTAVDLQLISSKTGQPTAVIVELLKQFERDGVISLNLSTTDASLTFIEPREDERTINRVASTLKKQNENKTKQVFDVLRYISNVSLCKSVQLLEYFGDVQAQPCGICSVCASQKSVPSEKEILLISEKIIFLLEEEEALSSRDISEKLTFADSKIVFVLRLLMEHQKISLNTKNQYTLS